MSFAFFFLSEYCLAFVFNPNGFILPLGFKFLILKSAHECMDHDGLAVV